VTDLFIGVDLGGTGTRTVVLQADAVRLPRTAATRSIAEGDEEARVRRLASLIQEGLPSPHCIRAVGIGASGPVDITEGRIDNDATLPWFSHIPLREMLSRAVSAAVVLENDAGQKAGSLLMVTLGTGIGAALLVNGEPFRGSHGAHPEAGHIRIDADAPTCYCGLPQCWEQAASRLALERLVKPFLPNGTAAIDVLEVAGELASSSQELKNAFTTYGTLVGRGLAILHSVYRPEVTVLGGSVVRFFPLIKGAIEAELLRSSRFSRGAVLRCAELGDYGGAIGAGILARKQFNSAEKRSPQG